MQYNIRVKALLMGVFTLITGASAQQFTNVLNSGWWRTNPTTPNIGRGVAIGNLTTTPYPAAFQVHGDLLPVGNQTPEVFRTNAPTTGLTSWRMFQGGTTAGFERGQLFADPANTNFNINAPNGGFLLLTQNVQRARFNGNVLGPIGLFPAINRDGFLMLSGQPNAFVNGGSSAPFTRLHLIDGVGPADPITYAQTIGFRPWQRNGITFTGNSDQSYIGHRYAGDDNTDFVIQWNDNPNGSPWGTDRMRFVFTTQYVPGATRGATSVEGLEAIRLWPQNSQLVNVGIGDFFAGNQVTPTLVQDPTERLDILNGRLRIRQLPDDAAATDSFYVMVVDRTTLTSTNQERGVVKWVPPSVFCSGGGGADCKWTLIGTGNANIATAYPGNPGCPQYDRFVGIGTNSPAAKLHVKWTGTTGDAYAGAFQLDGSSTGKRAGDFSVSGTGTVHQAIRAIASGASSTLGTEGNFGDFGLANATVSVASNHGARFGGDVIGTSNVNANYGLEATTTCQATATITNNYGVYARTFNQSTTARDYAGYFQAFANDANAEVYGVWAKAEGGNAANRWAGYFDGQVKITGNGFVNGTIAITSDGQFKTDVQDVTGALDLLGALRPRSYAFNDLGISAMDLPDGRHMGFIAQELQEVLPELVLETNKPAELSEDGAVESGSLTYKAVDYIGLIPLLVAAMQEQQRQIVEMNEQLAACCANPTLPSDGKAVGNEQETLQGDARSLQIQPNPFSEQTTVSYTLELSGRAQLLVNSADGKQLKALYEAVQDAGQYQYTWNTGDLVPGVYYVTLLLDGEPLVKKAVKVAR